MNYKSFATHSATYSIDGHSVTVTADFVKDRLFIKSTLFSEELDLNEYENFEGDMREFVTKKLKEAA